MARNISISLGSHFEEFVDNEVAKGRFKNVSEVILAGLRLLEEKETKIQTLKMAIENGMDSGLAKTINADQHLLTLKATKRKNM